MLGRIYKKDLRDLSYKMSVPEKSSLQYRYWDSTQWYGNQGTTSMCVGYGWAHYLSDGPVYHKGVQPVIKPEDIYHNAQKMDEYAGEDYEGTSVRGGAKYLQSIGKIGNYYWAWDVDTIIQYILSKGPVVVGTNWTYNMFSPDENGFIKPTGGIAGGHCYVLNGVSLIYNKFRLKNSWSQSWGINGSAYISIEDFAKLLKQQGEAACATELNF